MLRLKSQVEESLEEIEANRKSVFSAVRHAIFVDAKAFLKF